MKIVKSNKYKDYQNNRVIKQILASGLGRTVQHLVSSGSWGILSAHSTPANKEYQTTGKGRIHPDNKQAQDTLKDQLKQRGIGFIQMKGAWVDEALGKFISEDSLLIPNITEPLLKQFAEQFKQQGYIFGENGHYWLKQTSTGDVWQDGEVKDHFRQFYNDDPEFGYSEVKGRQFILDPKQPERVRQLQEENQEQEVPVTENKVASTLKVVYPYTYAFQCYAEEVKWATNEGILNVNDNIHPYGRKLAAYLPLKKA